MKRELSYLEAHYGSQQKTADALGVSLRTYQRWRHGEIPKSRALFIRLLVKDLRFKAA